MLITDFYFDKFVEHYFILKNTPNILVSPLEWGIGHATRCVPIIRELLRQNAHVFIGADGRTLAFFQLEFPSLEFIKMPGYRFAYPSSGSMAVKMAMQAPAILKGIKQERKFLNQTIKTHHIDAVISDNRYGLSNKQVPCIFITHQIEIKVQGFLSFLQPLLNTINRHYISRFNECWIPDFMDEPNLSGELSHVPHLPKNTFYIGPQSRFAEGLSYENAITGNESFDYDFLILLSGPEPQRTILEQKMISELKSQHYSALLVGGRPESKGEWNLGTHIKLLPHLDTDRLKQAICNSKMIFSRPGYSTIMDIAVLGKKAVFIPTPGQTEQEYLASYCMKKKWFYSMNQNDIDLEDAIKQAESYTGVQRIADSLALKERISALLNIL